MFEIFLLFLCKFVTMETILIIISSVLVGLVVGYMLFKFSGRGAEAQLAALQNEVNQLQVERGVLQADKRNLAQLVESERERADEELQRRTADFNKQLEAERERAKEDDKRRREEFEQQLQLVGARLKEETAWSNRQSITELMTPYKQQLEELKKQSGENRASLETHIKTLVETGGKLSHEADRLARALSSDVRMQGHLGEKLLRDLLAGSGLVEGKQYLLQSSIKQAEGVSLKNEDTGKTMKPDAMIFYPATKSVLYIDSKFQLPSGLEDNMDVAQEQEVLRDFSSRLRTQVKSLASRGYQRHKYEEYISLPYVIMFVPSDKALMAVTAFDKTLWLDAFNSKVFIASERHLLMLIEMISVVWVQQQRLDNQDKIVSQAQVILDRVTDFLGYFDDIGVALKDALEAYESVKKKGIGNGQTISVAVRDMLKYGATPQPKKQRKLHSQLVDAGLESSDKLPE